MFNCQVIKIARIVRGISQWELAGLTGLPNYRLSLIENGKSKASGAEMQSILSALKIPHLLSNELPLLIQVRSDRLELIEDLKEVVGGTKRSDRSNQSDRKTERNVRTFEE